MAADLPRRRSLAGRGRRGGPHRPCARSARGDRGRAPGRRRRLLRRSRRARAGASRTPARSPMNYQEQRAVAFRGLLERLDREAGLPSIAAAELVERAVATPVLAALFTGDP